MGTITDEERTIFPTANEEMSQALINTKETEIQILETIMFLKKLKNNKHWCHVNGFSLKR